MPAGSSVSANWLAIFFCKLPRHWCRVFVSISLNRKTCNNLDSLCRPCLSRSVALDLHRWAPSPVLGMLPLLCATQRLHEERVRQVAFLIRFLSRVRKHNKVKPCTNRGRIRAQACLPSMQCALWESVKAIAMHVVQPIHFLQHGLALLLSGITSLASHLCQSLSATQTQSALHTVHSIGWSLLHG